MTNINLYHGGQRDLVHSIAGYGLLPGKDFFCSRQQSLAWEAASSYENGAVLRIALPAEIFREGLRRGYFEERPYLGSLPVQFSMEVVVRKPEGIDIVNKALLGH